MAQQFTPKNSGKSSIANMLAQRSAPPSMAAMPPRPLAPAPALAPRAPVPPTPPLPPGAMPPRMPLVGAPGAIPQQGALPGVVPGPQGDMRALLARLQAGGVR